MKKQTKRTAVWG